MLKLRHEHDSLKLLWSGEIARVEAAVTRAVDRAASGLHAGVRNQTAAAGLGPGNVAAWRRRTFPGPGRTSARAAALVWSRAPLIVDAFDRGALIRHKAGRHLAIPTGFNRELGRRARRPGPGGPGRDPWAGVRVTPAEMVRSKLAFTLPLTDPPGAKLWCLRLLEAQTRTAKRGTIRRQAIAGGLVRVGARLSIGRTRALLEQGFVPMFVLLPAAKLDKRLDLDAAAGAALRALEQAIAQELR